MIYNSITPAKFISRPNRFIANVLVDGKEIVVHVKNTGRCKELLIPGCEVYLEKAGNPERKTPYDLVAVRKDDRIINIDSQAPNAVVKEYLEKSNDFTLVKPEHKYGDSRIDFYMEKENPKDGTKELYLMEVKGCTLFIDGIGYFPDAPTQRGAKHLRELAKAAGEGYHAMIAFVIQGEGIYEVRPNSSTDPEFASAYDEAIAAGVEVLFFCCKVRENSIMISETLMK
ncbi:DNA/RNA nuclease SfsA [Butyrivibrio sp. YAB3001]|uniref:DNA/RNA nuclease SfsA n=1 Tax=Butyrivibrio sp. YAB3001 TaxID=1520812 RepID=UPI0008F65C5D|nr:DNA/RNA nuclease SfsA [Butyrivibrio sp. YAB3001]SFB88717.1 sugar fermentation stimulation protein A [Butyrivibrio sp. YAB3001]